MFNLLPYYILSAPLWAIHPHMNNKGDNLHRPLSVDPLIPPISVGLLKDFNYTVISVTLTWGLINRCPCFYFLTNPCRSLLSPRINSALILCLTKDYWALSSRWQKTMPIKVEEQIYLISSLIIWSIYQLLRALVLHITDILTNRGLLSPIH